MGLWQKIFGCNGLCDNGLRAWMKANDRAHAMKAERDTLKQEADRAWGEFHAEVERTDWQADQHAFHAMSRDAYRQVGQEQKARYIELVEECNNWQSEAEWWEFEAEADDRSRRGWEWLYTQKVKQWLELVRYKRWYWEADKIITNIALERDDLCDQRDAALRMTKDWHETNGELEVELARWKDMLHRTSQGRDENYRSYQQERTSNLALQSRLDDALLSWDEERARSDGWEQTARENESEIIVLMGQVRQSDGNTQRVEAERDALHQRLEVKETTIERLEGALKIATANDGRDSRGRFTSRDG